MVLSGILKLTMRA